MEIIVNPKKLEKILSKMLLKGKYFSGTASVSSSISNYVVMQVKDNCLNLFNGNNTTLCAIAIPTLQTPAVYITNGTLISVESEGECVVEISSLVTRLKSFNVESVIINAGDVLTLSTVNTTTKFTMALTLNHPNPAMIHRAKTMIKKGVPFALNTPYLVGKTELNTILSTTSSYMESVVKGCDVINVGKYKFDFKQDQTLTISSVSTATNKFSSRILTISRKGEPATVEFAGPFFSFFAENTDSTINIIMRDDSPIVFFALDRIILKAPFVEG
tara:strand:+ start:1736 stop:2557 length:822 start_codon:yes stop_codon:yes gene_type:complete